MGLVDELRGLRICIDTAPFIYCIEKDPKYLNIIRPLFAEKQLMRFFMKFRNCLQNSGQNMQSGSLMQFR
jgi:hypothetical protein